MIVMDLDGTLLNENGCVDNETKDYLSKLKSKGYIIAIATGRILKAALVATDGAYFANYIVSSAGSAVYKNNIDSKNWDEVYSKTISKEIAKDIIEQFDENKFSHINICEKDFIYAYTKTYSSKNEYVKIYSDEKEMFKNINNVTHISASFYSNKFVDEYLEKFIKKYPSLDIKIMQDSFDDEKWIEIFIKGVEKYGGIYKISQIEKVENKDIIAFGDGLNDIDMIEKCGIGVAMKNALKEVKEKSKYITEKSNKENGIKFFLENYL